MPESEHEHGRFLLESWLDLGEVIEQDPQLRKLLFDPVTGLPTTPLLFPRIKALLEERGEVSLVCLNIVRYSRIEEIYGWKVLDDVMRQVADVLDEIAGDTLRDSDVIAELMNSGSAFVIVLSPPRTTTHIDPSARLLVARRIEEEVRKRLAERIERSMYSKFGCYVGSATIEHDQDAKLERLVYEALERALAETRNRESADATERITRLRQILVKEEIHTLLHPVFDLSDMRVVGYEALSRGPEDGEFERPDKLFAVAYDADLVLRLERVCRKRSLEMTRSLPDGQLLFLNIEADAVGDPQLREIVTTDMAAFSVDPARVVLELSERSAIADFGAFRSTLDFVRALGFGVAVDDAGAGYGSLQCLGEVRPGWLKIDLTLVRGCDGDQVRAALIASLVGFAAETGAKLVAEGIETAEELETLRALGVGYGQGYLLAMPSTGFPDEATLPAKRFAR